MDKFDDQIRQIKKQKKIYAILTDTKGWVRRMEIPRPMEIIRFPKKYRRINNFIAEGHNIQMQNNDLESVTFRYQGRTEDKGAIYVQYAETDV